jgi:hypothetical protein
MDAFLKAYYDKFELVCGKFKISAPWSSGFEEFKCLTITQGSLALFAWLIMSFSPCIYTPGILERFIFVFKMAMEENEDFFK